MSRRRLRKIVSITFIVLPVIAFFFHMSRSIQRKPADVSASWLWEERPSLGEKSFADPNLDQWPAWMLAARSRIRDFLLSYLRPTVTDDPETSLSYSLSDVDFVVKPFLLLSNGTSFKLRWVLSMPIELHVRAHATLPSNDQPWRVYPKTNRIKWDQFFAYEVDITIPEHIFPTHLTYRVSFPGRFDFPRNAAERKMGHWLEEDVRDVLWERTTGCLSGPDPGGRCSSVSIAVFGDNQFGATTYWQLMKQYRAKFPFRDDSQYWIHLGDAVQGSDQEDIDKRNSERERQWRTDFFSILHGGGFDSVPLIFAPGNHDIEDLEYAVNPLAPPLMWPSFDRGFPYQLDAHPLSYYSFSLSSAYFIILNSNLKNCSIQHAFLLSEFQSESFRKSRMRIVVIHTPPFIEFWNPDAWLSGEFRWNAYAHSIHPLLVEHNVTIVLSGHQHSYQRGKKDGITYIISGGAGGSLDNIQSERVNDWKFYQVTESKHHFGQLVLYEHNALWEVFEVDSGEIMDRIEIKART